MFMRDVRSGQYYEQMKGRGARTIAPADLKAVTDDADAKTRFVIVDAIGVTEHDFVEPPLNREKSISLKKLLDRAAALTLTEDEVALWPAGWRLLIDSSPQPNATNSTTLRRCVMHKRRCTRSCGHS